jgi:hypothetical protein
VVSFATAVLVALAGVLVGFALRGLMLPAPERPPAEPPPARRPVVGHRAARSAFREPARVLAAAFLADPEVEPEASEVERLGVTLENAFVDGWAEGVTELRAELGVATALPPELVDHACGVALDAIEGRADELSDWPAWADPVSR